MATNNKGAARMRAGAMVAAATLLLTGTADAQLYRWTDPSGRVHFTDTPPPPSATNVQKKRVPPPSQSSKPASEPYVVQQARTKFPVTLYTAPGCDACSTARTLLNERGVPFKEVSVADEASADALKKAVGGSIVPAIVVGANTQMGFRQETYSALLDQAGYPRAGILPAKKTPATVPGSPPPLAPLP